MISKLKVLFSKAPRLALAAFASSALMVSGCATTSMPPAQMTAEQRVLQQRSQAMQRTVWQGAATGALAGALFSAVRGGDRNDILQHALIGGVAGAALGSYLGQRQREYADAESQIGAVTADIRQKNDDASGLIQAAELVIVEHRSRLAQLNSQYEAGLVDEATRRQELASILNTQRLLSDSIESTQSQLGVFEGARTYYAENAGNESDLTAMDAELEQLSQSTERLVALNDELAAVRGA